MSTASFAASQDIYNGYPVYERYPQVVLTEDLEDSDLAMAIRNGEYTVDVTGYVPSSGSSYTVLTYRGSYNGIDYILEARPLFKVVGNSSTRTYLYVLFVKTATRGAVYYYSGDIDSLEDFNNVVSNQYTHVCFKDSGPMRILSQSDNLYTLSAALDFIGGPIDTDELGHYNGYMTHCIQMYCFQNTVTPTHYYGLLNTVLPNIKVGDEHTGGCVDGGTLETLLINNTVYAINGEASVHIAKYRLHLDTNTFVDFYLTSILDDEHLQNSPIAYEVLKYYFLSGYVYGLTLTEVKEGSSDSYSLA